MQHLIRTLFLITFACHAFATTIEMLNLDVISYEDFVNEDPETLTILDKALHEKGIVGMKGIPTYKEKVLKYIEAAREFSALPESIKESYAPKLDLGELFLGYEKGKEKFQRPDGRWVIDDLKVSYYGFVPDSAVNKWPAEVDLKTPFQEIGVLMSEISQAVMIKIGLIGPSTGMYLDSAPRLGRALYYCHGTEDSNPYWCGAHFDHGLFTVLLPAFYFSNGTAVAEPLEAGLFVKTSQDGIYRKVAADDPDVMLFQVGEFGQLVTNDGIRATEHRVHKATGPIERYTMALFNDAPMEAVIHSTSVLTKDARYGGPAGTPCSYRHWNDETFKRFIVKEDKCSDNSTPAK